jgi:LacI family transcriptional regulator
MGVTLKDIAARAGVSRMAVSAVVNQTSSTRVSKEKREYIARIAEEMGYAPNLTAQVLSGKSSRTIGIFNVNVSQYSLAVLAAQFLRTASDFKYQLLIDTVFQRTEEEYKTDVLHLLRRSPDGVILLGNPPPEVMKIIKIPNVIIQHYNEAVNHGGDLYCDLAAGGYMAGLHLLAHKHRKAVYVCTHVQSQSHDKFSGLQRAWRETGLPDENLAVVESLRHTEPVEGRLLRLIREENYTCALMSNDFAAASALPFLRRNGVRVPEDFALIGYDANAFAYLTDPPLTTISQSYNEISTRALELLIERIEHKQTGSRIPRLNQSVKPVFFKGGSCGCPCEPPPILGWTRDMLFPEERFNDRTVAYDEFIARHRTDSAGTEGSSICK